MLWGGWVGFWGGDEARRRREGAGIEGNDENESVGKEKPEVGMVEEIRRKREVNEEEGDKKQSSLCK